VILCIKVCVANYFSLVGGGGGQCKLDSVVCHVCSRKVNTTIWLALTTLYALLE